MGNKRKYVVLRAVRGNRPRDPFGSLSGIRFRESMIAGAAPQTESKVDAEELTTRDVRDLVRDPAVSAIAPAMPRELVKPLTVGVDAAIDAWGIAEVGAIDTPFDGAGIDVAVLDTGIDRAHDAFRGVDIVERDFSGSGDGDRNGHGTHCAGTIFGRDVGGTRIGVARGVRRVLIGKVLSDDGGGSSDSLFRAMSWALDQGARVVSMSLGFDFPGLVVGLTDDGWPVDLATSTALEAYRGNLRMFDAIMDMATARIPFDGGAVVVAAAGNESRRGQDQRYEIAASIPAAANEVISVAALQRQPNGLGVADFSNTLADISAPGVNILSARRGGGLVAMSGTSMATPHVGTAGTMVAGPTPAADAGECGTGFGKVASRCADRRVRARGRDSRSGGRSRSCTSLAGGAERASMAADAEYLPRRRAFRV